VPNAHQLIYRDPFAYCSHPSIIALPNGEWGLAFMESMRRPVVLHSPSDPRFYNVLARSADRGASWSTPFVIPGFDWYGVECPSLTCLTTGELLLFQWRWTWRPRDLAREGDRRVGRYERPGNSWARGDDGVYAHRSFDGGQSWLLGQRIDVAPYSGAYTIRSAAELPDGEIVQAVTDIPHWEQIYLLRSSDRGISWRVGALLASAPTRQFSEPAILRVGARLIVLIREEKTGYLHQATSNDLGQTWTTPSATPMWGGPPHLLDLGGGQILCTYGHRRPPYGIRACLSHDGGATWNVKREIVIRDDFPNANLGYPSAVVDAPGRVFVTYYGEDSMGVTCIWGSRVALD
jgi:hypothetical protein